MKRIFDDLHGYVSLNDLEVMILDHPLLQRLRRIKQTSLAFMVYPGAVNTRFSHTLGTLHITTILGDILEEKGILTHEETRKLRIASLLHDVGQFPFSHSIGGFFMSKNFSNSDFGDMLISSTDLKDILNNGGYPYREIKDILWGESPLRPIIDSDVDVDRMDYLLRDSKYSGVQLGNIDLQRLMDSVSYEQGKVDISEKGLYSAENFFIARLHMYQAVYYHKTILGYELLARKIYSDMIDECDVPGSPSELREIVESGNIFMWDDEWFHSRLYGCYYTTSNDVLKQKIWNLINRRGPKMVYDEPFSATNKYSLHSVLEKLESSNIPRSSIYPIEENISIIDKTRINFVKANGGKVAVDDVGFLLKSVPSRLSINRIYVDAPYSSRAREVIP
jgi:HD superfamily phosphohydrolase